MLSVVQNLFYIYLYISLYLAGSRCKKTEMDTVGCCGVSVLSRCDEMTKYGILDNIGSGNGSVPNRNFLSMASHKQQKILNPTPSVPKKHNDGLVQERHNSIDNALELCLSCTNPSIWCLMIPRAQNGGYFSPFPTLCHVFYVSYLYDNIMSQVRMGYYIEIYKYILYAGNPYCKVYMLGDKKKSKETILLICSLLIRHLPINWKSYWICFNPSLRALHFMHTLDRLTHWGRDKMAAILQTTFSNPLN